MNFPLEVIDTMRKRENICNYLDIPLQHCNSRILQSMNRGINKSDTIRLIETIREKNPDIRLRTTMIAGYPGETREEFEELLQFVEETCFDRLGCFPYCHEEHAPSYSFEETLSEDEKRDRVAELMELQERVSEEKNLIFEGKEVKILIDMIEDTTAIGRTEYDAPEVDNECILTMGEKHVRVGSFCLASITDTTAFELHGSVV